MILEADGAKGPIRYRFLMNDDIQTHYPEFVFSRDFPFSLLSPKIAKNNSFRHKAHCFAGELNATHPIASHLVDELSLLLQKDKAEIDSYAQLRVNQYKSMFDLARLI